MKQKDVETLLSILKSSENDLFLDIDRARRASIREHNRIMSMLNTFNEPKKCENREFSRVNTN